MTHGMARKILLGAVLLAAFSGAVGPVSAAWAREKGKIKTRSVLVTTKQMDAKVEDKADHAILYIEQDGMAFNEAGGKFLDKARYQLIYMSDSSGMVAGGYKTFTEADGTKVFVKFADTEQTPPIYKGTFELIGGTGKYVGIKGKGTWTYTTVADTVAWDVMDGEYELP